MAKNNSFVKLEGTLDNLTFYRRNGESLVKTKSSVSRARIMHDPKYKRTRENMREFGGAATAAKSFRTAFSGPAQKFGDTYLNSRMTGIMKRIVRNGAGNRGERDLNISDHLDLIKGFEFNFEDAFSSRFYYLAAWPEISVDRNSVTWSLPGFSPDALIKAPDGASHFKLVLAAGYVSNFEYHFTDEKYQPVDGTLDGTSGNVYSAAFPLNAPVASPIDLSVVLMTGATIPADISVFVGIGIVFYQEINSQLYELAQGQAMYVAVAG